MFMITCARPSPLLLLLLVRFVEAAVHNQARAHSRASSPSGCAE
jgi:hypothetical protein